MTVVTIRLGPFPRSGVATKPTPIARQRKPRRHPSDQHRGLCSRRHEGVANQAVHDVDWTTRGDRHGQPVHLLNETSRGSSNQEATPRSHSENQKMGDNIDYDFSRLLRFIGQGSMDS